MPKAKPKKKKKRPCRERSPESEETDFRTFNLQRIAPEAHRLQNQEFELLMDTARHVHRTMNQQEIKKMLRRPTWALRKWRRENLKHGHFTWREEFSLLQVMRGNDAGALHDDQGNCSATISESMSEDDESIANVCRQKPTEDEKKPAFPGFIGRAHWCEEAEKHVKLQGPSASDDLPQISGGPDRQNSDEEHMPFPASVASDKAVDREFPMSAYGFSRPLTMPLNMVDPKPIPSSVKLVLPAVSCTTDGISLPAPLSMPCSFRPDDNLTSCQDDNQPDDTQLKAKLDKMFSMSQTGFGS
jgi:hypothetical protein